MTAVIITISVVFGIIGICLAIFIPLSVVNKKYRKFILEHSDALKELDKINRHYNFNIIRSYNLENSYDNENFFDMISTKDYLIYQLVEIQKPVLNAMNDTYGNKIMYEKYRQDIKERCKFESFDTNQTPKNKKRLSKVEKNLFLERTKDPQTEFFIHVFLKLTDLNGRYLRSKHDLFYSNEIRSLIGRINNKRGNFYLDEQIWSAIAKVERGKVSNKLRFAIYARDGNRCRICGRKTDDLEIDHIIPISKGGKSTYGNLQTLCHRCNKAKGDTII